MAANPKFLPRRLNLKVPAGKTVEVMLDEYVFLHTTNVDLEVGADNGVFTPFPLRLGFRVSAGDRIGRVYIRNPSGTDATAILITGFGFYIMGGVYGTSPLDVNIASPNPLPVSWAVTGMAVIGPEAIAAVSAGIKPVQAGGIDKDGKVREFLLDTFGKLLVAAADPSKAARGALHLAAAGATDIIATPGAGKQLSITSLVIFNDDAAVDDTAIWLDDATEIGRLLIPHGESKIITIPAPGIVIATNKALRGDVVAGGGSMRFFAYGYVNG